MRVRGSGLVAVDDCCDMGGEAFVAGGARIERSGDPHQRPVVVAHAGRSDVRPESTPCGSLADRAELERGAQDLHAEASSENPEPGRLRQFAIQLKDKLLDAGTTIAATMGAQMADQALAALVQ